MLRKYFLFALLLLALACCARKPTAQAEWHQDNGKLKVLTTIAMIEDIVSYIGGDEVDTLTLIKKELDPHSYDLVKGDDDKFARADILFYNGLGLEHGLSLRQNILQHPAAVAVTDPILVEDPQLILETDGQYDPHIWLDISLWTRTIDPIVATLSKKDPKHAALFAQRGEALRQKMQEVDDHIYQSLQAIDPQKRYLVTSHDAFHYFARRYLAAPEELGWQVRCKAPEGLAPEAQIGVHDIQAIVSHVETFHIHVLFPESNVSHEALHKVVEVGRKKGFQIRMADQELYSDTMGNAHSYLDMIAHNAAVIKGALTP